MQQLAISTIHYAIIYFLIAYSLRLSYVLKNYFLIHIAVIITFPSYVIIALQNYSISFTLSILISILLSVTLALFIDLLISKMLDRYSTLENWQLMIASIAFYTIIYNSIAMCMGDGTISFRNWPVTTGHSIFGFNITNVQIISIVIGLSLIGFITTFMRVSSIGQRIAAVSTNSRLSTTFGIDSKQVILIGLIIAATLASISGILISADIDSHPNMGFNWLLRAVVVMIISGNGDMKYLFYGAIFLSASQYFIGYMFGGTWMDASIYFTLIIFLFLKPFGFSAVKPRQVQI